MKFRLLALLAFSFLGLSAQSSPGLSLDDEQLLRAIDALQAPIRDFYFEYEGERLEDKEVVGNDTGKYQLYSGIFKYKAKDQFLNDIYNDLLATKINPERQLSTQTILSTELRTELFSRADGSLGKAISRHVTSSDFDETGSFGRVYLVRQLRQLLLYDKKLLLHEGTEEVDGVSCEKYAFVLGAQPYTIETGLVYRFWIDMDRNGHVLKEEVHRQGQHLMTVDEIVLEKTQTGSEAVYIPVKGKVRFFADGHSAGEEHYRILKGSVKLNQGLADAQFTIKYPMGTPISDHLKGVVYEFGQDRRPPPESLAEAQSRLQETAIQARDTRSELVAAPWSRSRGITWAFWGPLAAFVVATLSTVVLYLLRARGTS